MKTSRIHCLRIFVAILLIFPCLNLDISYSHALENTKSINRSSRITWLERPWEVRYVLFVMSKSIWESSKKRAIEGNHDPKNIHKSFARWQEFFEPTHIIDDNNLGIISALTEQWIIVPIFFDRDGWVTSPNTHPGRLRGRIEPSLSFVLSEGDSPDDKTFDLGFWFMGINEYQPMGTSPAFCEYQEMEPLLYGDKNSISYRYGNKFYSKDLFLFGCREWGYQLRAPFRPYIDVTSYSQPKVNRNFKQKNRKNQIKPKNKSENYSTQPDASIIYFMGWGDFEHRKPVIGKDFNHWFCFFECPNGEAPGPIDIESWTKRNGWRVPIPPTRMPVFPDDPERHGDYPDAYNPLSD